MRVVRLWAIHSAMAPIEICSKYRLLPTPAGCFEVRTIGTAEVQGARYCAQRRAAAKSQGRLRDMRCAMLKLEEI
jgi:hypothetical protein